MMNTAKATGRGECKGHDEGKGRTIYCDGSCAGKAREARVQKLRNVYAAYMAASGKTAESFYYACRSLHSEMMDGECEGKAPTPEQWVRYAEETAWSEMTRGGHDKAGSARWERLRSSMVY